MKRVLYRLWKKISWRKETKSNLFFGIFLCRKDEKMNLNFLSKDFSLCITEFKGKGKGKNQLLTSRHHLNPYKVQLLRWKMNENLIKRKSHFSKLFERLDWESFFGLKFLLSIEGKMFMLNVQFMGFREMNQLLTTMAIQFIIVYCRFTIKPNHWRHTLEIIGWQKGE